MDIQALKILVEVAETMMPDEDPGEGLPTVEQIQNAVARAKEQIAEAAGPAQFTTADLGFAIRDSIENALITQITFDSNDVPHEGVQGDISFVDVGDPNNPEVELSSGQRFRISIVAI
ncbi:hypothetical protein [Ancylobacter rudongensis]|uniref:Uncharacterized protein n=1 Tax=Ancylobacter rudongensis TaxID=177413 RepID=A0A1G4UP90_9HYPH|nr:hypothetical protein [Ancylobacter rudongensis]SCW95460.1 hypothetical protein SAMN05660859_0033 [Ancylobacter rudongensis]